MRRLFRTIFILAGLIILMISLSRLAVVFVSLPFIDDIDNAAPAQVALVPGAGLSYDGTPSLPLRDRIDAAIELYNLGKVQKILMTGDNMAIQYNEPEAMRQYAISKGVHDSDIVLDYAGRRTYDSCYRAREIFLLDSVIITTQRYHLYRAVYLCNSMGLEVRGIAVEQSNYHPERYAYWRFREVFATISAILDINIFKPLPILGEAEPIFQ